MTQTTETPVLADIAALPLHGADYVLFRNPSTGALFLRWEMGDDAWLASVDPVTMQPGPARRADLLADPTDEFEVCPRTRADARIAEARALMTPLSGPGVPGTAAEMVAVLRQIIEWDVETRRVFGRLLAGSDAWGEILTSCGA